VLELEHLSQREKEKVMNIRIWIGVAGAAAILGGATIVKAANCDGLTVAFTDASTCSDGSGGQPEGFSQGLVSGGLRVLLVLNSSNIEPTARAIGFDGGGISRCTITDVSDGIGGAWRSCPSTVVTQKVQLF
jgi:hypothetical protein